MPWIWARHVAHAAEEVGVGTDDAAVQVELDDRHGPVDGLQFVPGLDFLLHPGGDVKGVFDHFVHRTGGIADRVVAGLQPQALAGGAYPLKGAGLELAVFQAGPQLLVIGAASVFREAEQSVRLADHLVLPIAQGLQEIVVGSEHRALEVKLDHRHGAVDGLQQTGLFDDGLVQGIDGLVVTVE